MERTLSSALLNEKTSANTNLPMHLLATLLLWRRRIISRRQLARLDTRLLADAGISESERYAELSKPFWR